MTATTDDLHKLRDELKTEIKKDTATLLEYIKLQSDSQRDLSEKIGAQTVELGKLSASIDHYTSGFAELKTKVNAVESVAVAAMTKIAVLEVKQGGVSRIIEKLGYPIILAALVTYIAAKGP